MNRWGRGGCDNYRNICWVNISTVYCGNGANKNERMSFLKGLTPFVVLSKLGSYCCNLSVWGGCEDIGLSQKSALEKKRLNRQHIWNCHSNNFPFHLLFQAFFTLKNSLKWKSISRIDLWKEENKQKTITMWRLSFMLVVALALTSDALGE